MRSGRLLLVGHEATRTGAPIVFLEILRWLRRSTELELGVVLLRGGPLVPAYAALAPTVVAEGGIGDRLVAPFRRRGIPGVGVATRALRGATWQRTLRPDVVYASTAVVGELVDLLTPRGTPVVAHVHELALGLDEARDAATRLLERADRFIVPSGPVRTELEHRGVRNRDVRVIPEPIAILPSPTAAERAAIRTELGIPLDALVVGGAGTVGWRKGTDLFIQLSRVVRRRLPDRETVHVWIGGSPEGIALELGRVLDAPAFRGLRSIPERADARRLFAAFDVLALTSREDPLPLVALECAVAGVPTVAFEGAGGVPELLHGAVGAVPFVDLEAMADVIAGWANDDRDRRAVGTAARARVVEACAIDVVGPQVLDACRAAGLTC